MSVHAIILANQSTKTLERTIHALKAQTAQPEAITVLANINLRHTTIPAICTRMEVVLRQRYDPEMINRQTSHAYHMLPDALSRVKQDRVMVFRDSDILQPRLLQTMEAIFTNEGKRTCVVCSRWLKTSIGEILPRTPREPATKENTTFANSMLSVSAVKLALGSWQPDGIESGNDLDLILAVAQYGQMVVIRDVLVESDPIYFCSIYESREPKKVFTSL